MSAVDYEADSSGGLMAQIQALIAPPISDDGKDKAKKVEHPYFKRPGRGHNHDSCDSCGEGGDLICCDKCPSSFHLQCHDPPLETCDIPHGEWLCHSCKNKVVVVAEEPQLRSKRSMSSGSLASGKSGKKFKTNYMDVLIQAARVVNPKQFELPRNVVEPCNFPGTDKVENPFSRTANRRNLKIQKQQEKAAGAPVSLPGLKCYICSRSCRSAPLLSCDYCPLSFHLDCLDPPLTSLPAGRWMCPNHVEHLLDSKLLQSISATERNRLWNRFNGQVDQDTIKLEFFRKVHRKNPPFRIKVKLPQRNKVSVPPMVKHHYKKPVQLLPSLRDVLRLNTVQNREYEDDDVKAEDFDDGVQTNNNVESCREKRNGVFKLNCAAEVLFNDVLHENEHKCKIKSDGFNVELNGLEDDDRYSQGRRCDVHSNCINDGSSKDDFLGDFNKETCKNDCFINKGDDEERFLPNGVVVNGTHSCDVKSEICLSDDINVEIERELKQLDDRLLKLLAFQRIQQILTQQESTNHLSSFFSNTLQNKLRHMPLPSELLTPADIDRISRVFSSPKRRNKQKSNLRARAMLCPVISKYFYNVRTSDVDAIDVRHDASFMGYRPTVSARFPEATAMRYRSISIGRGSSNDLELDRYGHCNFVSPKHAVVFFDEHTKHYELMNYSCYGTYVNNVLYSNNVTDRPQKTPENRSVDLDKQVREIVDKRRKVNRTRKNSTDNKMIAIECLDRMECSCDSGSFEDIKNGWEGPAVLNHGSLLRFGCVSFVFSIVDCATL